MAKNAVLRIVLLSVSAVILIGILVAATFGAINFDINSLEINTHSMYENDDPDLYTSGGASMSENVSIAENVNKIDINWYSGSVTAEVYDGETIEISETGADSDDTALRYRVSGDVLYIKYSKEKKYIGFFSGFNVKSKQLLVRIPRSMAENMLRDITVNTASADVSISGMNIADSLTVSTSSGRVIVSDITVGSVDIEGVSGGAELSSVTADELSLETVSGDCRANGSFGEIFASSVSGRVDVASVNKVSSADMSSVSGDLKLSVPEECGYTAEFATVSGKFHASANCRIDGSEYVFGNGESEFDFETVSGDAYVN